MQRLRFLDLRLKIIIFTLLVIVSLLQSVDGITVSVNGYKEFQTIQGLGGGMESHYSYEYDSHFWDLLFHDLGVSAIYLYPLQGHSKWDEEEVFPLLIQAKNYGVVHYYTLVMNYPLSWKDSNDYILPKFYKDVAHHILNYVDYIKGNTGVDITNICAIDEPSIGSQGRFERFKITPSGYADFLKVGAPIIRDKSNLKIHAPDDWNISISTEIAEVIMADPIARNHVDYLSTHVYGWSNESNPLKWQAFANIAKDFNKETYCSEDFLGNGNPESHPAGINLAKRIHHAFVDGNATGYLWWFMLDKGKYSAKNGLIHSKYWPPGEFTSNGLTKLGNAFKQYAHWIRPGAIRVEATSNDSIILISSFKHSDNNMLTIVAINDKPQEIKSVTFYLNNLGLISNLSVYRTSVTENSAYLGQVPVRGNSFTYTFPKESITTFTTLPTGDSDKTKKAKIRR